ncbi:hypothetical protein BDQ12DRAFT_686665 [Crucibulum laeve]|uniref:Uncharacterized protein n=1 Tax=Crucibulum laeve TaxID=68775 RepID=A0A5C3M612_9AGAR|nr:hypothetical protein BDQ12DRAFT_686665 [Crucibulum laeve]
MSVDPIFARSWCITISTGCIFLRYTHARRRCCESDALFRVPSRDYRGSRASTTRAGMP